MFKMLALAAAFAFAASAASATPMLDAKGKCRDNGKFVAASMCKTAPAPAAAASGSYTLDAKGNCHDAKGKMAKKSLCAGASAASTPPPAVTTTTKTESTRTASATVKHCTKGKPCGKTCISVNDVCHK